jgi:hypothetical protein
MSAVKAIGIKRFTKDMRVRVIENADGIQLGMQGTVARVRMQDDGAWVALDQRSAQEGVHPFPEDDDRGTHTLCYPEGYTRGVPR